LWANEPEDARKLQLELLLLEVTEETVEVGVATEIIQAKLHPLSS
jgi:hypothetical protein